MGDRLGQLGRCLYRPRTGKQRSRGDPVGGLLMENLTYSIHICPLKAQAQTLVCLKQSVQNLTTAEEENQTQWKAGNPALDQ